MQDWFYSHDVMNVRTYVRPSMSADTFDAEAPAMRVQTGKYFFDSLFYHHILTAKLHHGRKPNSMHNADRIRRRDISQYLSFISSYWWITGNRSACSSLYSNTKHKDCLWIADIKRSSSRPCGNLSGNADHCFALIQGFFPTFFSRLNELVEVVKRFYQSRDHFGEI